MAALATLLPVSLALGLLMFGSYGTHRPPAMTPGRVVPVLLVAILIGPVAVAALGFVTWLAALVLVIAAILMAAMLRTPPLRH